MKAAWCFIGCFMTVLGARGQLTPLSNQYLLNPMSVNPAFAGSEGAMSITLVHRNQWTGFEGAPVTTSAGIHSTLRDESIGLGLLVVSDRVGISSSGIFMGNFAYRIRMDRGTLALGLAAGIVHQKNQWDKLVAADPDDGLLADPEAGYTRPDFSIGVCFTTNRFHAGLSLPLFLSHEFNASTGNFEVVNDFRSYNYFLDAGYVFFPEHSIRFLPSLLVRFSQASELQADLNLHAELKERVRAGITYRTNRSVVGLLMVHMNRQLSLAYTFESGFGEKAAFMGASHEVMLRYRFKYYLEVAGPGVF